MSILPSRASLTLLGFIALLTLPVRGEEAEPHWSDRGYDPNRPVVAKKVWELAALEKHSHGESRALTDYILRAAAQRDDRFRKLIDRESLRKSSNLNLAMLVYDYSITGNKEALDLFMAEDAKLPRGGDYDEIVAMAFLDEWDRTIVEMRRHQVFADGAAGHCMSFFWGNPGGSLPERDGAPPREHGGRQGRCPGSRRCGHQRWGPRPRLWNP